MKEATLVVGRRYILRNNNLAKCIHINGETAWMCDPNSITATAYCWNVRSGESYSLGSEYDVVSEEADLAS